MQQALELFGVFLQLFQDLLDGVLQRELKKENLNLNSTKSALQLLILTKPLSVLINVLFKIVK